jgi:DNA-binding beta-propeller fold protein YncE
MRKSTILFVLVGAALFCTAASAANPNQHVRQCAGVRSRADIALPMGAFAMLEIHGSCKLLATLGGDEDNATGGIALINLGGRTPRVERVVSTPTAAIGIAITRDRRLAVIAGTDRIYVVDLRALAAGEAVTPIAIRYAKEPGTVSVALTPDERLLFASDEGAGKITVLDFAGMRRSGFAAAKVVSSIGVDYAPTVLAVSPNGQRIYVPVEGISRRFDPPILCRSEGGSDATPVNQVGGILTIDVSRATSDPQNAVIGRTPAGCSPVRLAMSPDGLNIWVTNRLGDTVRAFDSEKLVSDPAHSQRAVVAVGHQPIGLALLSGGALVAVANASRWDPDQTSPKTISVFQGTEALAGKPVAARAFKVGIFPRDLAASGDGQTLYVSNFGSRTITIIPAEQLQTRR